METISGILIAIVYICVMLFWLLLLLALCAVSWASYIMGGIALMDLSKRRGIKNGWLAWIPVTTAYVVGQIADDHLEKTAGKKTVFGKLLLWGSVAINAVLAIYYVVYFGAFLLSLIPDLGQSLYVIGLICSIAIYCVMLPASIAFSVFYYIAYYHLFAAFKPEKKILFLMLSIFVGIPGICVFLCRKQENTIEVI